MTATYLLLGCVCFAVLLGLVEGVARTEPRE